MEEMESTLFGSPEIQSPPTTAAVASGGVVPQVMNMAVSMSMERSLAIIPASSGAGAGAGSTDGSGKKKRGRPRKYDADGNLRPSYLTPKPVPPPGFSLSSPSPATAPEFSSKKGRGRAMGSGNWQLLASLGEMFAKTAGCDFTPHVVTVSTGEDVAAKILSFCQKGPRGICVLSANGAVSNVTIRQPGSSGGILTYEGRFEILSLTGSFTVAESDEGMTSRTGGLSVSLAGPDGRVIGGCVAGLLMAASPIQTVVGSFMPNAYKTQKKKHQHEQGLASSTPSAPDMVIPGPKPIPLASPDGSIHMAPSPQFQAQSHGDGGDNNIRSEQNPNGTANRNGSEPAPFAHRPSPDINVPVHFE